MLLSPPSSSRTRSESKTSLRKESKPPECFSGCYTIVLAVLGFVKADYSFYSEEEFPALPLLQFHQAQKQRTMKQTMVLLRSMQTPFVVFLSVFVWRERRALQFLNPIPKQHRSKNGTQLFHTKRKKSFFCLFVSLFCRSLSLSLSVKVFGSLEAHTFEEEELRFLRTRSLERLRNNKV